MGGLSAGHHGSYRRIDAFDLLAQIDHDPNRYDGNNGKNQGVFDESLPLAMGASTRP
jgi:hypothetical protein